MRQHEAPMILAAAAKKIVNLLRFRGASAELFQHADGDQGGRAPRDRDGRVAGNHGGVGVMCNVFCLRDASTRLSQLAKRQMLPNE